VKSRLLRRQTCWITFDKYSIARDYVLYFFITCIILLSFYRFGANKEVCNAYYKFLFVFVNCFSSEILHPQCARETKKNLPICLRVPRRSVSRKYDAWSSARIFAFRVSLRGSESTVGWVRHPAHCWDSAATALWRHHTATCCFQSPRQRRSHGVRRIYLRTDSEPQNFEDRRTASK